MPATATAAPLEAKIQRTKFGVPHITAKNIQSLAAGFAYAFAQDNICTIANEYVTVRAERSRFFGPDKTWDFSGNGSTYKNLDADIYFGWVKQEKAVEKLLAKKAPEGPTAEVRRGIRGYVAGYNQYLRDVGRKRIPDRRCRGAAWVRPIKVLDVYRRFYQIGRCPVEAATFVTYSQSENQRSRHASDYTRAFSKKRWNRVPFCQRDVQRQTRSTKRLTVRRR